MVYTTTTPANILVNPSSQDAVPNTIELFNRLSVDDQLGLLWFIYKGIGTSITPAAPGAARLQFAEGLLNQIKEMPQQEQLEFMRNLARKVSTPLTRAYGVLTNNTKLAFWYQLAVLMDQGVVIPVPSDYKMSTQANSLLQVIKSLSFNQQITVLRKVVADMGMDPLAS